jgi:hypothetical protein
MRFRWPMVFYIFLALQLIVSGKDTSLKDFWNDITRDEQAYKPMGPGYVEKTPVYHKPEYWSP